MPAIKNFSSLATTDEGQITTWFTGTDYNIGICTDDLLVVDVDVKNKDKNGLATIEKLKSEGKFFPDTSLQVTPTNGMHLLFRPNFPVRNSVSKLGPGLDIRGRGGFIVGMGSTINGVAYKINKRAIAPAPDWLVEACEEARDELSQAKEVAAVVDPDKALARGKKYLDSLPPTEAGNRNHEAYKIANHLKDIGVSKEDIFFLMSGEEWKCEPPLELEELEHVIRSAFNYGIEPQGSKSPEAAFPPLPPEENPDEGIHPVEDLNKNYAYVLLEGKHRILYETKDSDEKFKLQFLEEQTFHTKLASRTFVTGAGTSIPLSKLWMKDKRRRSYEGICFKPETPHNTNLYNMWQGWSVKDLSAGETITDEMKRGVAAFEEHIFENVVEQNTEHYTWVMSWFAHMIQKPWEKPKTALVLRGKKGVGKNAIFETFHPMFPNHYLVSGNNRYLTSNFNGHLERLLMFVADEAFWSGDKASEGILKSLITDPKINIEKKGRESTSLDSCHRIAILGNEKWVVPASHDERRYAIFNMGEGRKQDRKFFTGMHDDMLGGGNRYLFHKLKQLDLSMVDVGQIPLTQGLLEQKNQSSGPFHQWWKICLQMGYIRNVGFSGLTWETDVSSEALQDAFHAYANKKGRGKYLDSDSDFLNNLREVCPSMATDMREVKLPDLSTARFEWDKYMGMPEKW